MLFPHALTFVNAMLPGGASPTTLRVAGGRILAIGAPPFRGDRQIDCRGDWLLPGLINAHDHLELNNFGRLKWRERYHNVREWIADFRPRFGVDPTLTGPLSVPLADRLYIGGLKNLFSGVTTVAHHNPLYPPLRRPNFPVRVVQRCGWSHSLLLDGEAKVRSSYRRTPAGRPWIIHLAEGVDAEASGELARLDALGCLRANTLIVHGVGLTSADRALLLARGAGLIWCPASNDFLFGATADVADLAARGRVALGSDSRLSGAGDLLDELRVAREVLDGDSCLSRARDLDELPTVRSASRVPSGGLLPLVTSAAARLLRLPDLGVLRPGALADLLILPAGPVPAAGRLAPDPSGGAGPAPTPFRTEDGATALAPSRTATLTAAAAPFRVATPIPFDSNAISNSLRAVNPTPSGSGPALDRSRALVPAPAAAPDLSRTAVLLVMRAGRALYADPCYASAFTTPAAAIRITVEGAEKLLARSLYREGLADSEACL